MSNYTYNIYCSDQNLDVHVYSQVDTLRLAIGYISFLAELVANDRHPADVLQNTVPEPPKKIYISSAKGK